MTDGTTLFMKLKSVLTDIHGEILYIDTNNDEILLDTVETYTAIINSVILG